MRYIYGYNEIDICLNELNREKKIRIVVFNLIRNRIELNEFSFSMK